MGHVFFDLVRENEQRARLTGSASSAASWKPSSSAINGSQNSHKLPLAQRDERHCALSLTWHERRGRRMIMHAWTSLLMDLGGIGGGVKIDFLRSGCVDLWLSLHTLCWMNEWIDGGREWIRTFQLCFLLWCWWGNFNNVKVLNSRKVSHPGIDGLPIVFTPEFLFESAQELLVMIGTITWYQITRNVQLQV